MFFLIGVAAGAVTGIPIGPVNVAVIDAAYRHTLRRAMGVALGGAVADGLYSALGLLGVKPILDAHPGIPPVLYLLSGAVLLVYGFLTARSQPVPPAMPAEGPHPSDSVMMRAELQTGVKLGLALIVLNPAAITVWVVMMANIVPTASIGGGIACAFGVMIGSFAWFSLVAFLTLKGKSVLGDKAAWIPRAVGVGLMGYSLYLLFKAVKYYFFA